MFPEEYTSFIRKINAIYDGDPNGNYVMAEDVNELQQAIERLERALGIKNDTTLSINQRIINLERYSPLKVSSSLMVNNKDLLNNVSNTIEKLSTYRLISYKNVESSSLEINKELLVRGTLVYGQIDSLLSIDKIQELIGVYKKSGASGIHILNLGNNSTRVKENQILNSIHQNKMSAMIQTDKWNTILKTEFESPYNPEGVELKLKENDVLVYDYFAYYQRQFYGNEIKDNIKAFLDLRKKYNVKILGNSWATNQKQYSYIQSYGLIYSLDYIYDGNKDGSFLENITTYFSWPVYVSDWKTNNPVIFTENTYEYRIITGGRVVAHKNMNFNLDGYTIDSDMVKYLDNTIPGKSIIDYSMPPEKLSHYDVDRIVDTINKTATVKIDPEKIDITESGNLPINIPASNMKTNVILAINQKNDADTTEEKQILDAAIKNLNSKKLFGDIEKERMSVNIIKAINESKDKINVKYATIEELSSSVIQTSIINSTDATIEALNVTLNMTALNTTIKDTLTAYNIEAEIGRFVQLYAENFKVENLQATNLAADNIASLIIDTIELNVETGVFDTIVAQSLTSNIIKAELITAVNSMVGEAVIDGALIQTASIVDAQIVSVNAGKLTAGEINTALISMSGPDGHMIIKDNNIRIYDAEDSEKNRRLRVLIGELKEITNNPNDYGLVVLGADGSTRLYDNTGVYNAGLHDNVISNEKIQDNAVTSRVIKAKSVFADHIIAGNILTEHLKAGAVTADKIAARSIVAGSAIIDEAAISNAHISELHGAKIIAGTITAKQIKAESISADKLAVGYQINLIRNNYDSFESFAIGSKLATILSGAEQSIVAKEHAYLGVKSYLIRGNNKSNKLMFDIESRIFGSTVLPKRQYIISTYIYTNHSEDVSVRLGAIFKKSEQMSEVMTIKSKQWQRIFTVVDAPDDNLLASFAIETLVTNVSVWIDCLQIEEKQENQEKPGWWRSTGLTKIDGSMIETGYVEAQRIRVGEGTIFGNGDIIELSNQGIKAKGQNGTAMMNSNGIEIIGGAFYLNNEGKVNIDGKKGITIESPKNKILIDANDGITILNKINDEKIMYTTVDGELYVKGKIEVTKSDTIYNKSEIDASLNKIDLTLDNLIVNLSENMTVSVGMKLSHSSFDTISNNHIYIFGYKINEDTLASEPADINGSIKNWENNKVIVIPKQAIGVSDVPKQNAYIAWDNTFQKMWIIAMDRETEIWKQYNTNNEHNNANFIFNESTYIIGEVDFSL